jgi:hypothetical protein
LRIVRRIWDLRHGTESVCGAARQIERRSVAVGRQVLHVRIDISIFDRKTAENLYHSFAVEYLFGKYGVSENLWMAKSSKQKRTLPPPPPSRLVSVFDDPPRKNVLLLSCMDQRMLDETVQFMNSLNLHNRYDQTALAGSAMGVHRLPENPTEPSATWWATFTAHLATAINELDRPIKDVFLLDHLDCGAYKVLHPVDKIKKEYPKATLERMRELHADELAALACRVHDFCEDQCKSSKKWEHIRVSCFIADLRGQISQLNT